MVLAGELAGTGNFIPDDWTTWTPTYNNITVGNGTVKAAYIAIGGLLVCRFHLTWGSTTSYSSTPIVTLPFSAHSDYEQSDPLGTCFFYDNSVGSPSRQGGTVVYNSGNVFFTSDGSAGQTMTATVPFTWATSDKLAFEARYELA